VKPRRLYYCGKAAEHQNQMRQIFSSIMHLNISNYLMTCNLAINGISPFELVSPANHPA